MITPEFFIILINLSILSFSYFWLFPNIAASDIVKLSKYDFLSSMVAIGISGYFFYGTFIEFNAIFFNLNWFWFTFLTFFTLEIPFAIWYLKKIDLFDNSNQ